ncbi:MAG TPA: LytTR family DNA-binding domain-containing protein [Prolixibacteraceae bacterium]|nr:LytTR family DNA-binding domain-containing protein [Prolixibacteraceae bacterium]
MRVLLVEDEPLAAAQLASLLTQLRPTAEITGVCDTIQSAVSWFQNNTAPDLAFFDIQLGDGLSFEIFKNSPVNTPVIFTTAYDQYALQAFKVNSIDYLLKPIIKEELAVALDKFDQLHANNDLRISPELFQPLIHSVGKKEYRKRFLVKIGTHLKAITTEEILYFYSFQKGTFLKASDGRNYLLDQTLEVIEELIDPELFFRINRKYLVAIDSITDVHTYSNSRLKLKVKQQEEDDFLVAREKVKLFKEWLEGKS